MILYANRYFGKHEIGNVSYFPPPSTSPPLGRGNSSANCSQQARWWRAWHSDGRRVPPPGVACFGEGLGNNFRQSHAPLPICFASTSGHGCTGGPCPCGPGPGPEPGARIAGWAQRLRQHLTHLVSDCAQIRRAGAPSFREAFLRPSFHILLVGRVGAMPRSRPR